MQDMKQLLQIPIIYLQTNLNHPPSIFTPEESSPTSVFLFYAHYYHVAY